MTSRQESGRSAKLQGHIYEHIVSDILAEKFNTNMIVHGAPNTKIDICDESNAIRLSLKNASTKNTQVSLITQSNFLQALEQEIAGNEEINEFVNKFFGGNDYANYPRHRMSASDIDSAISDRFIKFMNDHNEKIMDLLMITGFNQIGDVNYMIWSNKNTADEDFIIVDLNEFKKYCAENGEWILCDTTLHFIANGVKLFHLQMKGSGPKYTSGYHSLQFHIYGGNFDLNSKYVVTFDKLQQELI